MKKQVALLLALLLIANPTSDGAASQSSNPETEDFFRGVHMGGNWGLTILNNWGVDPPPEDYLAFLRRVHANWVGISVSLHIDGSLDSTVERVYEGVQIPTFTDEALVIMIDTLHQHGFNVYLTLAFDYDDPVEYPVQRWQLGDPNMPIEDPSILPENWPWALDHPNHESFVAEFWQTYTNQAVHFGELAEATGVEMYALGAETDRLFRTRSGGNWPNDFGTELATMVNSVKSVYSSLLTYGMTYYALTDADFYGPGSNHLWGDLGLDVVGISAYFELVDTVPSTVLSVEELETRWTPIFDDYLIPLRNRNPGLPIVFLEFGYVNAIEAPFQPNYNEFEPWAFEDLDGNGLDDSQETQANIYQSFFNVNEQNQDLVSGAFLWGHDWGSDEDWASSFALMHHFAVRDKLAEDVVSAQYAKYLKWVYLPVVCAGSD